MPLEIKFGKNIRVFESGTLIQFKQENLTFELKGHTDKKNSIQIEVRFINNKEKKETSMYFENGGINHLIMNLENFDNKIGHGNTDPVRIGTLDNYELYFSFRVTSGKEDFPRTIEYTFYLGEEVKNA